MKTQTHTDSAGGVTAAVRARGAGDTLATVTETEALAWAPQGSPSGSWAALLWTLG